MIFTTPPRYAAAAPTRTCELVARLEFNRPSRVRVGDPGNDGKPYRYLLMAGSLDTFLDQPIPVWIGHLPPAIGTGVLTANADVAELTMQLSGDQAVHRQLVADASAGKLTGLSFGGWTRLGFTTRPVGAAEDLFQVTSVVELGEVSVIVEPECPTFFSSCWVRERR